MQKQTALTMELASQMALVYATMDSPGMIAAAHAQQEAGA